MIRRRRFLIDLAGGAVALLSVGCRRSATGQGSSGVDGPKGTEKKMSTQSPALSGRMPVVFAGHGSPMNAIEDTKWSQSFTALGQRLPRPRAILVISAHWFVGGTLLTAGARPKTIHDFGGFPRELYEVRYPAPGKADLAARVRSLIGEDRAALSTDWGLDHGTWSVLKWMYPDASVPVVQLSIDRHLASKAHYELARSLAPLRSEGVLVMGSGNVTHNLRDAFGRMRSGSTDTPEWATRFDRAVAEALSQRDASRLVDLAATDDGRMAHPTLDHYLPLIYARAAAGDDPVAFPTDGFDSGSISMRTAVWG